MRQGRSHNPSARRLLEEAGVCEGMRVLDAGTGAGDVAIIAAELVGEEGSDLGAAELPDGFDAVVGRFVLQHHPEPILALRSPRGSDPAA